MNNKKYLENERIYLRAVEPTDLEIMYEVENHPSVWEVSGFNVPYSRFLLKQYIESTSHDLYADKQLRLMIIRKSDHVTLGIIDITDFVPLHGRGAVGIVLLEDYRGNGYAKDALKLLCEYCFNFLHMKQLYAFVAAGNTSSINLFAKCGFVQSGLLKEWIHTDHTYQDAILMQCVSAN